MVEHVWRPILPCLIEFLPKECFSRWVELSIGDNDNLHMYICYVWRTWSRYDVMWRTRARAQLDWSRGFGHATPTLHDLELLGVVTHTVQSTKLSLTMASSGPSLKGYDCQFVNPTPSALICPICTRVARDPQQALCCGKIYCRGCVEEAKTNSNSTSCEQCKDNIDSFPDRKSNLVLRW